MGNIFEKLADFLRFDKFSNAFHDYEEVIMTKGLRFVAVCCLIITLIYGVIAYIQFSRM